MTASQQLDAYRFFIVAFGAAPGVTFMNQLDEAYASGMSTQQIVNVYTTKPQFLSVYPKFLSHEEFASRIVESVVGTSATAAAKQFAKDDIFNALSAGMSRGDVIYQIFNNLAQMPSTNSDWANMARKLANQVEYAKYFTQTLGNSTMVLSSLQSVVRDVTENSPTSVTAMAAVLGLPAVDTALNITVSTPGGEALPAVGMQEGGELLFSLQTSLARAGTIYPYTLTGISASDTTIALTGLLTIGPDGRALLSVPIVEDLTTEGMELVTLTVAGQSASGRVIDASTTLAPSYSLTASDVEVNEGNTLQFTLATTNVAEGTSIPYTITGVSSADITGGLLTGVATVGVDGRATIAVGLVADQTSEGPENLVISLAGETATARVNDSSVTPRTTFRLTTGNDRGYEFVGTDADNTYDATLSTANTQTLNTLDSLDGGAGNDTLTATLLSSVTPSSLANIETLNVTFLADASQTLNLLNAPELTSVVNTGSTVANTIADLPSGASLQLVNTSANATFAYRFTASNADTATLTLSNVTNGAAVTLAGVEAITLNSTTVANNITPVFAAATTLNLGGTTYLTLSGNTNVQTVNSTNPIGVFLTSALPTVLTGTTTGGASITGGDGNDTFVLNPGAAAARERIVAGAGNDTVTYQANLSNADTIEGGTGTNLLAATSAQLGNYAKPTTATISGFQTLRVTDSLGTNLVTDNLQANFTTIDLAAGSGTYTLTLDAGSRTVNLGAANSGTLTIADTGNATTDTLSVVNTAPAASNGSAANVFAGQAFSVNGFETVTLTGSGTGNAAEQTIGILTHTADAGGTAVMNLAGSNSFRLTAGVNLTELSADGLTANATLNMAVAATQVTRITGGVNGDVLRGDASSSIHGGAGNDTLYGGSGNDTLLGGDGNDILIASTGMDTINGGLGNDRIDFASAEFTSDDSIDGGEGTNTLNFTNALGTDPTDSAFTNVVRTQAINLAAGANSLTLGSNSVTAGVTSVTGNTGIDTLTLSAGVVRTGLSVALGGANDYLTVSLAGATAGATLDGGDGSSDVIILNQTAATSITADDIRYFESVTVNGNYAFSWTTGNAIWGTATGGAGLQIALSFDSALQSNITFNAANSSDLAWNVNLTAYAAADYSLITETSAAASDALHITLGDTNALAAADTVQLGGGSDYLTLALNGKDLSLNLAGSTTFGGGVETLYLSGAAATATTGVSITLDKDATSALTLLDASSMTNGLTVNVGDQNTALTLRGSSGADVFVLGEAPAAMTVSLVDGGADTVRVAHSTTTANRVTVQNFTVGTTAGAFDFIDLVKADGSALTVSLTQTATTGSTLTLAATDPTAGLILTAAGAQVSGSLSDTTNNGVVETAVMAAQMVAANSNGELAILVLDNGTDTGIYRLTRATDAGGTSTVLDNALDFSLELLVVLTGISNATTLVTGNGG
jgi:hypothetical protein